MPYWEPSEAVSAYAGPVTHSISLSWPQTLTSGLLLQTGGASSSFHGALCGLSKPSDWILVSVQPRDSFQELPVLQCGAKRSNTLQPTARNKVCCDTEMLALE